MTNLFKIFLLCGLLLIFGEQILVQFMLLTPSAYREVAQAFLIALVLQPWVVRQF